MRLLSRLPIARRAGADRCPRAAGSLCVALNPTVSLCISQAAVDGIDLEAFRIQPRLFHRSAVIIALPFDGAHREEQEIEPSQRESAERASRMQGDADATLLASEVILQEAEAAGFWG